jgi:4-amino-4-deoxy-L-arabinose transferase-like glycosyltransferase
MTSEEQDAMKVEPIASFTEESTRPDESRWCGPAVALAALVGLGLMVDALGRSSATYDEVAYLRVAARWWRTGDQAEITRMGSPLTFWKLQQVPVLWTLDHLGRRAWVDDPIGHQEHLLPLARLGGLWIWVVAFGLTALWSRQLYGPKAMVLAAWLFALGPNLLAHGPLATMEFPLLAATMGMFWLFWRFLQTGDRRTFWATAAIGGLAWSCKFTTVVVPPLLALAWWVDRWRSGERGPVRITVRVASSMIGFLWVLFAANLVVTGFATLPLSTTSGPHPSLDGRFGPLGRWVSRAVETPIPQDWVGFATQMNHQRSGGSSYLFGERRMTGWWYYYFVALAVKVPLTVWVLVVGRAVLGSRLRSAGRAGMLPLVIGAFLAITALGSSRNYGLRYMLPLAPLAIVWVSGLAEAGPWARRAAWIGLVGQAAAVASIHPHELTYFNALAGGPVGGRHVLADSNLDWGQGLKSLARLQRAHPEWRDLTLYYFGDTDPRHYGVAGICHVIDAPGIRPGPPPTLRAETAYLAVSASLQWGPWGPEGYFRRLGSLAPVGMTDDRTIAIYRVADIPGGLGRGSRGDVVGQRSSTMR